VTVDKLQQLKLPATAAGSPSSVEALYACGEMAAPAFGVRIEMTWEERKVA
jgi:hypothetical protein